MSTFSVSLAGPTKEEAFELLAPPQISPGDTTMAAAALTLTVKHPAAAAGIDQTLASAGR